MSTELTQRNGQATTGEAISQALPEWMVKVRQAVTGAIKPEDLEAIFAKQVELAKGGDRKAAQFVLDQARAYSELKGISVTQNNYHYHDGPRPDEPASVETMRPGSKNKVELMRRRVDAGMPATSGDDEQPDLS